MSFKQSKGHWDNTQQGRAVRYSDKFMYGIVLYSHYSTVQKYNGEERSKTIRSLTIPCINLLEYWTSMLLWDREILQSFLRRRFHCDHYYHTDCYPFYSDQSNNMKTSKRSYHILIQAQVQTVEPKYRVRSGAYRLD